MVFSLSLKNFKAILKYQKLNTLVILIDVTVTIGSNGIITPVFIKTFDDNQTLKYVSIAPLQY